MYFITDEKRKIIFGYTPKCGCKHILNMFYYLTNIPKPSYLHNKSGSWNKLPENYNEYIVIIFIRDPYKRIISGFREKYRNLKYFYHYIHKWNVNVKKDLTFKNFVNELYENGFENIDKHHFTPQLSEDWNYDINITKIYDLENIDYSYLEKLYNKKIDSSILDFKGNHIDKRTKPINYYVYDLTLDKYLNKKPKTYQYYNKDIENKVSEFYKEDLEFFKLHGFEYKIWY